MAQLMTQSKKELF